MRFRTPLLFLITSLSLALPQQSISADKQRPNILMIVAEDMSPRVGVMATALANTLNRPAGECRCPVHQYAHDFGCRAPSRSSLVTGVYATSMGTHQMRTSQGRLSETITGYEAVPPPEVKAFPEQLRAGGYSTANGRRTISLASPSRYGTWMMVVSGGH